MKSKTLILMGIAVVCGLGASYMTARILADRPQQTEEVEKVTVLVAKKNIPQGTFIKVPEEWFIEKEFVKGEEPKKAVRAFDEVKDRVVSKPLSAEQWVVSDDLLRRDQYGIIYAVPKGMRAMAIRVNVDTVVAGFVQPNSRVDVLNTVRREDTNSYTQTILQNMLVLAVDQLDKKDQEKIAIVSSTVTLAVTPEDAQVLSLAQQMGELRLVLRPNDDTENVSIRAVKPDDIRNNKAKNLRGGNTAEEDPDGKTGSALTKLPEIPGGAPGTPDALPIEPIKRKKPHSLTVMNGDSITKAVFLDEEDGEITTQIQKSDAEPKPKAAAQGDKASPEKAAPEKHGTPEKPAAPEKGPTKPDAEVNPRPKPRSRG
jgi:pilus assembly protein CpaB